MDRDTDPAVDSDSDPDSGTDDGHGDSDSHSDAGPSTDRPDAGGRPTRADGGHGDYETLRVEREDGVARLVLDRPERMNSVNVRMIDDLDVAVDRLDEDPEVGAVLLVGAGDRAFSAGADVGEVTDCDPREAVELSRRGQRVFGRLRAADTPVVAAIDGFCLGGGMELATCADLRVAASDARFGQTEHTLGLLPGWGGTQRLRRIVGDGRAREVILTAGQFDARTMYDYGFVNEVVDPDSDSDEGDDGDGKSDGDGGSGDDRTALERRARELAADLAAGPPVAQAYTKRAMGVGADDVEAGLEFESQAFGHVVATDDVEEGVAAFREDRDPEFTGE